MPLSGLKIIDLTRIISGPFCAQLLADMGAEVIKVEAPRKGDPTRRQGAKVDGFSYYFAQFNRNKKSITVDLYTEAGRSILVRLLEDADVLLENYRPGVLERMGFDQARLDAINPSLVIGSVSGYGSIGPYVDRPAFDFIGQAMSGFMSINGPPDSEPMRAGPPISDLLAGLYAAFGVVIAIVARSNRTDNAGQRVEASLNNSLISSLAYFSAHYFATGEQPIRTGNDHPIVYPYGLFKAKDGSIAVAPSNDIFVERFLEILDLTDLLEQPFYATNKARLENREQLRDLINERTAVNEVSYWIDVLNRAGVPAGRVQTLDQVFNDPQVLAQDMVLTCGVDHNIKITGFPVKLSATPARLRLPPPALGEHTEAVLMSLGYMPSEVDTLRETGII